MSQKLMQIRDQINVALHDSSKPWTSVLQTIEGKTGVDRFYLFLGLSAFIALWLVFGYAAQLLCNTVSFLYPAYVSIHAIESKSKDDDTKWLTYWVVFALFSIVEFFAEVLVCWFPFYWLVKCIFMVWLMVPTEFNGSIIIYSRIVRPYFLNYHGGIDATLSKVKDSAAKILDKKD